MDPFCSCDPEIACDCGKDPRPAGEVHYGSVHLTGEGNG